MRNLQRVINNSGYLIMSWIRVLNLATHVLSQVRRRLQEDCNGCVRSIGNGLDSGLPDLDCSTNAIGDRFKVSKVRAQTTTQRCDDIPAAPAFMSIVTPARTKSRDDNRSRLPASESARRSLSRPGKARVVTAS